AGLLDRGLFDTDRRDFLVGVCIPEEAHRYPAVTVRQVEVALELLLQAFPLVYAVHRILNRCKDFLLHLRALAEAFVVLLTLGLVGLTRSFVLFENGFVLGIQRTRIRCGALQLRGIPAFERRILAQTVFASPGPFLVN